MLHNLVCTFECTSAQNAQAIASNFLFIEVMLCVLEGGFYSYNNAKSKQKPLPMQVSIWLQHTIPVMFVSVLILCMRSSSSRMLLMSVQHQMHVAVLWVGLKLT